MPWNDIFAVLRDVRFDRYIIFQTYNSSRADFAYTRGMFHNVYRDGDEFVRRSLAFLRDGLCGN